MLVSIVVLTTIGIMLVLLALEIFDSLKVFPLVMVWFLVLGYLDLDDAIAGFSNKGVLAIAFLYIVAGALERSLAFRQATQFQNLNSQTFRPLRLFSFITFLSTCLNNTPIVSLFIPVSMRIAKKLA